MVSDQYIRILNQLDRALTSEGLDTKICFLLYHELLWAPQKEKLDNPERFTMMFAPITRTFEMSYADVEGQVLNAFVDPVWLQFTTENQEAVAAGQTLQHIICVEL